MATETLRNQRKVGRKMRKEQSYDPASYPHGELTELIIGAIIEVHRHLGPGFQESIYEEALARELALRGIRFERQKVLDVSYKGAVIGRHKADMVVEAAVVLELKAVETMPPVSLAQTISTLKASKLDVALLVNFNCRLVKDGIKRFVAVDYMAR